MASWSLDKSFDEKHKIVSAKASALGISEGEAYRLCVVEYETGIPLNEVTVQTQNAYNQYKLTGSRPNEEDARKIAYELMLSKCKAEQRAGNLALKAEGSVKKRMEEKYGREIAAGGFGSREEFEKAMDKAKDKGKGFGISLPDWKFPTFTMPDLRFPAMPKIEAGMGGLKRSLQTTAIVVMLFVALLIYIVFVKGKGAEGVSVSAVGK